MISIRLRKNKLTKTNRIKLIISHFISLTLILAIGFALYRKNWLNVFVITGILFLTYLPAIIRKNHFVYLPVELDFIVMLFVYASLFLGEVHAYYIKFWWWDLLLHTSSGILFGFAGFFLVYILNKEKKVNLHLNPFFIALFSFALANMIGVIWEIFEFSLDYVIGLNMQKSGLVDTMGDLIVNSIGSLFVAILGFFYSKKEHSFFEKMINNFIDKKEKYFSN